MWLNSARLTVANHSDVGLDFGMSEQGHLLTAADAGLRDTHCVYPSTTFKSLIASYSSIMRYRR